MLLEPQIYPAKSKYIETISAAILAGKIIAFPTETVYALAGDASNDQVVEKIMSIKQRDKNKSLSILIPALEQAEAFAEITPLLKRLVSIYSPGAVTYVVKLLPNQVISYKISNNNKIGIRIPNHDFALSLLKALPVPVIGTSCNVSGHPSAVTAEEVLKNIPEGIDILVDGGECTIGSSSTVIDLTTKPPSILRQGSVYVEIE